MDRYHGGRATSLDQSNDRRADPRVHRRFVPGPRRGDIRRTALLDALEALVAERPLSEIAIADIARAAGVSRSAFYFYFPSKAAAVAASMSDFYEEVEEAGSVWLAGGSGTPVERLTRSFEQVAELWRGRAGLLTAMLDAVGSDTEVRDMWDRWVQGFVDQSAVRISEERAAGLTRDSIDPHALATVLVGAVAYTMERDVRALSAGEEPPEGLIAAVVQLWYRTIYECSSIRS
jgi:AcrR family transcriptional regulator